MKRLYFSVLREMVKYMKVKTKKNILPNNKKYTAWDYIRIPFMSCPGCTLIIGINRIVSAFIPSLVVLITANFIDTAIAVFNGEKGFSAIYLPILLYMLVVIFQNLNYTLVYGFINIRYDMAIYHNVRSEFALKRGRLEYRHIEDNESWNLISRVCDDSLANIAYGMNNLFDIADLVISIASILAILMTQVWWAAVVIMVVAIPLILTAIKGGREVYDARREVRKYVRRENYLHNVLTKRDYIEERALFDYSDKVNEQWFEKYEVARKAILKKDISNQIKMRISSIVALFASIGIIGVILVPTVKGAMSIGIFIALVNATFNIVDRMSWNLSYVARTFAEKQEYLKDLTKFMALSEREGALDEPENIENIAFDSIEFKNVAFKYPGTEKYILKDFNLKIQKNKHYAFVGINGAGKTTITKLLTGMYQDYDGQILINNKDIKLYSLKELKAIFTVVYQDFAKYQVSADDNILLGDISQLNKKLAGESYDMARRGAILKEIDLEKVIKKLPEGLSTYLGKIKSKGVDLSGGEWQRLAVARALYSPAHVRILDEPTAALDPVAESNVYKMFGRISKGKTTIFITHRLGAARLADEIIVIDGGSVAEKGSHDELIKMDGIYATMFESQKSWYELQGGLE